MTAYATLNDLLEVEPSIQDYGVLDWAAELTKSTKEVQRILAVRWWPQFSRQYNTTGQQFPKLDATLLTSSQWTQATVYHALAYHICPKLTQFEPNNDKFQVMMNYYAQRFDGEMDLAIREGVEYDADNNDVISNSEEIAQASLRLRR